jgi:flagellar L-ring protein FlgH
MKRLLRLLSLVASCLAAGLAHGESLYDPATYAALTSDNKAFRVGDVITVQVYESSSASASADTTTQRKNNLSAAVTLNTTQKQVAAGVSGDFQGGGTTQRTDKVLAILTVTVREVLPSGDLRLAGEQLLTVNNEQHKVALEGRVRPQDVSADNVVLSTRLADARITYVGDGDVSSRQSRAWWRKALDWLGF